MAVVVNYQITQLINPALKDSAELRLREALSIARHLYCDTRGSGGRAAVVVRLWFEMRGRGTVYVGK